MKRSLYLVLSIVLFQFDLSGQTEQERLALIALYNSTDGAHWNNNTNWMSSEPLSTWYGITVKNGGVESIFIANNNLNGFIPPEIGNLPNLKTLLLHGSKQLTGSIPKEIGNLTGLENLSLTQNNLTGNIPVELAGLTNLNTLDLQQNSLSGTIPIEIYNLHNLRYLYLFGNQLTGEIQPEVGNLSNMIGLLLNGNQLSGTIPNEIGNLKELADLRLGYNNFVGEIPTNIWGLTKLMVLEISDIVGTPSKLSWHIPSEIGNLKELRILNLSNIQLSDSIPKEIGNLTKLEWLILENSILTGSIPPEIGNLTNLVLLNLQSNQLTGSVPIEINNLTSLGQLILGSNRIDVLPSLSLTGLSLLWIGNNRLTFEDIEPNIAISNFSYSPQDDIGIEQYPLRNTGQDYTFSVVCGGSNNVYQWYKDEVLIPMATNDSFVITDIKLSDAGTYSCRINNTVAPSLTIYSKPVKLSVLDPKYLTVSNNTFTISAPASSTKTFDIISNTNWTVSSDQSWLVPNTLSGSGNATITLTAQANILTTSRSATITVSGTDVTSQTITATQEGSPPGCGTVTDIDGNVYNTVTIGTQCWLQENLKTTRFRDGSNIPLVIDNTEWFNLNTPGFCWYNNDESTYKNTYGGLYNWYAAGRNDVCPIGWHTPTDAEWTVLSDNLGGVTVAGGKLKEAGTIHWNSPNTGATNETGFTALPYSARSSNGSFGPTGQSSVWWSSSANGPLISWARSLYYDNTTITRFGVANNTNGMYIRCLKGEVPVIAAAALTGSGNTCSGSSSFIKITITGGTSPYIINYTRNGIPQIPITGYLSGSDFNLGILSGGTYVITLTSVVDAMGSTLPAVALPSPYSITIVPQGQVNTLSDQFVCNGFPTMAVFFTTINTEGIATYFWTNNNPSIGLAASGTGDIPSFSAVNTGTSSNVAYITVIPYYSNGTITCDGPTQTFIITVNPEAQVNVPPDQVICSGSTVSPGLFSTINVAGTTTYSWTNTESSIGLPSNGFGNIAPFIAFNPGSSPVTATITVTPHFENNIIVCDGLPRTFTITVNPSALPTLTGPASVAQNSIGNIYTTEPGMSNYTWNISSGGNITAGGGPANNSVTVTWNNPGPQTASVNYSNVSGCPAISPAVFNVTVSAGFPNCGTVTDIDGNVYNTVTIGTQCWMQENLKTTRFRDGSSIPLVTDNAAWSNLTTPGHCWNNNDEATFKNPYGAFYNWYTVSSGNLCPSGWHVPTFEEWMILSDYLGGDLVSGGKLKETGTIHWNSPNTGATNETNFSALPAGGRNFSGPFLAVGEYAHWWCSPPAGYFKYTENRNIYYAFESLGSMNGYDKRIGMSVRCLQGDPVMLSSLATSIISSISGTNGTGGGTIASDGGASVTARGVCWNTSGNPTIEDSRTSDGTGTGTFTSSMTGLVPGTLYYVRAYATNSAGTSYGNEVSFTTLSETMTATLTGSGEACSGSISYIKITITGGTSPYTVNYSRNGIPQMPIIGYSSGSDYNLGSLPAGNNIFTLTSVVDAMNISVPEDQLNSTHSIPIVPQGQVNIISDQSVCNGAFTMPVSFSTFNTGGYATYVWINNNPTIGLGATGIGDIPSFSAVNAGNSPNVAYITVIPYFSNGSITCDGPTQTFIITVNPEARVSYSPDQAVCNGSVVITSPFSTLNTGGATIYTWTNDNPSIGLPASGTGNLPPFTAINNGDSPVMSTITVFPFYNAGPAYCPGPAQSFTITVNPTPRVVPINVEPEICYGDYTQIVLTSPTVINSGQIVFDYLISVPSGVTGNTLPGTNLMQGEDLSFQYRNDNDSVKSVYFSITPKVTGLDCPAGTTVIQEVRVHPLPVRGITITKPFTCETDEGHGALKAEISQGAGQYNIQWTGPIGYIMEDLTEITNLYAGYYTVNVNDNLGCTSHAAVNLANLSSSPRIIPIPVLPNIHVSCPGGNDGTARIYVRDGITYPYSYQLVRNETETLYSGFFSGNYDPSDPGTFRVCTGLRAGQYKLITRDINGCETFRIAILNEPPPIIVSFDVSSYNGSGISCFGQSDGSITANVTGGNGNYSYAWTGPDGFTSTTKDLSGLKAGNYTIRVTDIMGCVTINSVNLTEPAPLNALYEYSGITCYGASDGIISISLPIGGSGSYEYTVDGGSTWTSSGDFTGLPPGTYDVRIRDAMSPVCFTVLNGALSITEPSLLRATVSSINVTCFGENNGSIIFSGPLGGSGIFGFSIDGGVTWQSSGSFQGLAPGAYSLLVRDASNTGCVLILNPALVITQPAQLTGFVQSSNVSCFGSSDGTINITSPTGGYGAYQYSINGGGSWQASGSFYSLLPGRYDVRIRDAAHPDCSVILNPDIVITEPPALALSSTGDINLACSGINDGSCTFYVNGGNTPYNFTVILNTTGGTIAAPGSNSIAFSNAGAGSITVNVVDRNGCSAQTTLNITQSGALLPGTISGDQVVCFGENPAPLTEIIAPSGGPGAYVYQWQYSANTFGPFINIAGATMATYMPPFNSTTTRYYRRVVTSGVCEPVYSNLVEVRVNPVPSGILTGGSTICPGESSVLRVNLSSGTAPFTIEIENHGTVTGYVSGTDIIVSPSFTTTYRILRIRDANNCEVIAPSANLAGTAVITINGLPSIIAIPVSLTVCESTNAVFNVVASGTNLKYQWYVNEGSEFVPVTNGPIYSGSNSPTLQIFNSLRVMDGYRYRLVVTGCSEIVTSPDASLTIYTAPEIIHNPSDTSVCVGQNALMQAVAHGTSLAWQWQVNKGSGFVSLVDDANFSGTSTPLLRITNAQASFNNWLFRAIATGICGSPIITDLAVIRVLSPPSATAGGSQSVCVGDSATVTGATYANGVILWTTNGEGGLSGSHTLTPTYTPVPDEAGKTITLTMTVSGTGSCALMSDAATYSVIVKESQSISFDPLPDKVYGDPTFDLTASASSTLDVKYAFTGDSILTISGNRVAITGSGIATIYASQQGDLNHCPASTVSRTMRVVPRLLIVKADSSQSKTYGDTDPVLSYSFFPELAGTDSFTGSLSRDQGENAGFVYTVNKGTLTAGPNYEMTFLPGSFTISAKPVSVTPEPGQNKTYGSSDPDLAYTVSPGMVNGDVPSGSLTRMPGENAGSYPIMKGSLSLGNNYSVNFVPADFTINKAPLSVAVDRKERRYLDSNPDFEISYSGFVRSENLSVLDALPSLETLPETMADAGEYIITASGGYDNNYYYVFIPGSLTILKRDQTITSFGTLPKFLRTTQRFPLEATASSGLDVSFVSSDEDKATISGDIMTIEKEGAVKIIAVQEGNQNWNPAPSIYQTVIGQPTFDNVTSLFTPNSDGMNDHWHIVNIEDFGSVEVKVYNRFGKLVYESSDYKNDWKGDFNGSPLPEASYYYIIKSAKKGVVKGVVNIVR